MRHKGYCPYCKSPEETTKHILLCTNDEAMEIWEQAMHGLLKKLHRIDTCWYILVALKLELNNWKKSINHTTLSFPEEIQQAIQEQRYIGWKPFLEGLISTKWGQYRQESYEDKNIKKTGQKWAKRLIKYTWEFIEEIWTERNKKLHNTQHIEDMEGVPLLKESITKEWKKGIGRLPASEFSKFFKQKLGDILEKSIETRKHWLMVVKQGRIMMDPTNLVEDEFTENKSLKSWIGISLEVTDKEGEPTLNEAITNEYENGIGLLPHSFKNFFQNDLNTILNLDMTKRKKWFFQIRQARIIYNCTKQLQDEFCYPGALQDWIGLQ